MALKFYSDIFEQCLHRKHILSPDDCNIHMDIHALPFSRTGNRVKKPFGKGFPKDQVTIGEHIQKKRMELRLTQEDVAKAIGVSTDCITNWENDRSVPQIHYFPGIIKFLGNNPFKKEGQTLSVQIQNFRIENGLSHERLAKQIEVDATTISSWENQKFVPNRVVAEKLRSLF